MQHFLSTADFSGRKSGPLVYLILLLGIVIGSQAAASSNAAGMNEAGATQMEYLEMVFSPDQIRLPSTENEMSRRYLKIMTLWIPTAMAYYNDWPVRPDAGHFFGGVFWYGLETAGPSMVLALAASSPEYDAGLSGYSREQIRVAAIKGLRYLCFTHDTGPADCVRPEKSLGRPEPANTKWGERGKGFFFESQAGKTITMMNITAAILCESIDAETWQMLAKINLDFLERFESRPPRHGVYYNTQLEENGWSSTGMISAGLFLSGHPDSKAWLKHANWWAFSAVTMPWDNYNKAEFADGKTVSKLCNKRFTILPDAMAENHGIVHPFYLSLGIEYLGLSASLYRLWGQEPPPHLFWNRQKIYNNLKITSDRYGYPQRIQGMDWPYFDMGISNVHAAANLYLNDPTAAYLEKVSLDLTEKIQALNKGRMVDRKVGEICHGPQDPILMNELHCAGSAQAYLAHRLMGAGQTPVTAEAFQNETSGVLVFPYAGSLFHKHPRGQVSFSWRNRQPVLPLTSDGVLLMGSPRDSIRAAIKVKDHPQSITQVDLNVFERNDRVAVTLVQDVSQDSVRRKVFFASLPDGRMLHVERLWAKKAITVKSVRQGTLKIINEAFACAGKDGRAQRTLYFPGGKKTFYGFVSENPNDDVLSQLGAPGWINVDDKMGIIFKGTGKASYINRHFFKIWYATADDLILSGEEEKKEFKKNEQVAELITLVCPDQAHQDTDPELLQIGQAGRDIELIRVGEWLCLANLRETAFKHRARFRVKKDDLLRIFPGTSEIKRDEAFYHLDLYPMDTMLYKSMGRIQRINFSRESCLKVDAVENGPLFLRNTGTVALEAVIHTGDLKQSIALKPGELKEIQPL